MFRGVELLTDEQRGYIADVLRRLRDHFHEWPCVDGGEHDLVAFAYYEGCGDSACCASCWPRRLRSHSVPSCRPPRLPVGLAGAGTVRARSPPACRGGARRRLASGESRFHPGQDGSGSLPVCLRELLRTAGHRPA
jgi:hypothetical protein